MTTETISLQMTWANVAPMLAAILQDGNATGQANAREELARMAHAADAARGWATELAAMREGLGILAKAARLAVDADVSKRDALAELAELAALAEEMTADAPAAVTRAKAEGHGPAFGHPQRAATAAPEAPQPLTRFTYRATYATTGQAAVSGSGRLASANWPEMVRDVMARAGVELSTVPAGGPFDMGESFFSRDGRRVFLSISPDPEQFRAG